MNRPIYILVSLLIALISGIFFLSPKNEALDFLKKQIQEKRTELQSKEEYLNALGKISGDLKNYETQLLKIDSALPDSPEMPALFDFLQKSASQSGLVLKGLDADLNPLEKIGGVFRQTRLNLFLVGSYSSLKIFLSALEKSARLIEVESISFTSSTEAGESLINAKMRIKVYSY